MCWLILVWFHVLGAGVELCVKWDCCGLDSLGLGFQHGQEFLFLQNVYPGYGAHPSSYLVGTRCFFPRGWSGQGMTLAIHLHVVLRLRISGAVSPLHSTVHYHGVSLILRECDSGVSGRSGRKWQEGRRKYIMRSFGICILHEMLIRMNKWRRMWWAGCVPCTRERGTTVRGVVGKPERESLERPRNRCEDNVRMNQEGRWWKNMNWNLVNVA